MKAIFQHPVLCEKNFKHLNDFMSIVQKSEHPFDLIKNLFEEGMLPDGLKNTNCKLRTTRDRVEFVEYKEEDEWDYELIAYATMHKIEF